MIRLYGIANCDTCRRARRWLADQGIAHEWVDLRADGVAPERLARWRDALGASALINKRSATWRDFDADRRATAQAEPIATLAAHLTLVKRPILEAPTATLAGFSPARYAAVLGRDHG